MSIIKELEYLSTRHWFVKPKYANITHIVFESKAGNYKENGLGSLSFETQAKLGLKLYRGRFGM